jgi:hypothetical protein
MSTDELERLVAASLHVGDAEPIDVLDGRVQLGQRISQDRRARRLRIVGIAAGFVAVVMTASLLLVGLRDHEETLPVSPPKVTLSASGLPIGLLEGKVTRSTGRIEVSNVRLRVFPGGTGTLAPGGGTADWAKSNSAVAYERLGPGRVAVRYNGPGCPGHYAFTMTFSLRGPTLTVLAAQPKGCLISDALVEDLPGTTFQVSPLPPGG